MTGAISEQDLALLNRGFELDSEGKFEQALDAFSIAAKANRLCAPRAHLARGLIYEDLNQPANAELEFRFALEMVPFNRKASYLLYSLLCNCGRLEEAITEAIRFFEGRELRETKPDDQLVLDYKASLERLLNFDDMELEAYRAAALRDSGSFKRATTEKAPSREPPHSKRNGLKKP